MEQSDQATTIIEISTSLTSRMPSSTLRTLAEFLEEHSNDAEPSHLSTTRPPTPPSPTFFFPEDLALPSDDLPPAYTSITPPPEYTSSLGVTLHQCTPSRFIPMGLAIPTTNKLLPRTLLSTAVTTLHLPRDATYRQTLFSLNSLAKTHAGIRAPSLTHRFFHRIAVERASDGRGIGLVDRGIWPEVRLRVEKGIWRIVFLFCMVERTWRGESAWRWWLREAREEMSRGRRTHRREGPCLVEEVVLRSEKDTQG